MTVTNDDGTVVRCVAEYAPDTWHTVKCRRPAKHVVGGIPCCGIHAKQARRWEADGRLYPMAKYWWGFTPPRSARPVAQTTTLAKLATATRKERRAKRRPPT